MSVGRKKLSVCQNNVAAFSCCCKVPQLQYLKGNLRGSFETSILPETRSLGRPSKHLAFSFFFFFLFLIVQYGYIEDFRLHLAPVTLYRIALGALWFSYHIELVATLHPLYNASITIVKVTPLWRWCTTLR